ncbi:hypothetical protein HZ326_18588 [Fusarium oxysporum f. sp. albedinis]|nr:Uncharacterized protein HZ326_23434 [Fusarium oxysporum f. sp. albedinis]KAJ0138470.1 hypothetical protein HZ326_18588 [Fusarium oxysporum f. sp. albedinis]
MSKEQVQEAMTLLSKVTVEQIQSVMQVNQETLSLAMRLSKPSPLESKTWSGGKSWMATGAASSFSSAGSSHLSKTGSQPGSGQGITVWGRPRSLRAF